MVTLAVLLAGMVPPARGAVPVVAIHDSEFTRALQNMPATGATPTGAGTTGFQWWLTNWNYFVMPDEVKEMLRSDGTAFTTIGDSNILSGTLLDSHGLPNYPIVISLASEAVDSNEVSQLTNYVAAGGMLFVGSSSFTRNTNGTTRGDFAIASQMGIHMAVPGLTNWTLNSTFMSLANHRLVSHIPLGQLQWQMPFSADEISWPEANHVGNPPSGLPHLLWEISPGTATVIAQGDSFPYILVQQYGKGWFIYDAAMQPLLGHGGWSPGMYAYGIVRNAIQWAYQNANMAVPKLSAWPYQYNAAVIFRHDMEALTNAITSIEGSALFEYTNGARGDYYFCTGELREDMPGVYTSEVASLQRAVSNYSATVMPHNGGLTNINAYTPALTTNSFDYWHWGPDEVLNTTPPAGYSSGTNYALVSMSNSFNDIAGWIPGTNNGSGLKTWVAPYFNSTREGSLQIESQLGIQVTGDDKLSPFPHWTLSTQTPDFRYNFLTLPVSEWYLGTTMAQAMDDGHTIATMQSLVDYYYGIGALVNLYSHDSSDGTVGVVANVASNYVTYSVAKPQMWATNVAGIYNWWLKRQTAQVTASYATNGNLATNTLSISGASDPNTAVEFYMPSASYFNLQVLTNGVAAGTSAYRTNGQVIKVKVGTTVTNAQVVFSIGPTVTNVGYVGMQGATLGVPTPGVLTNATSGTAGGALSASRTTGPANGSATLNANGSFSYTPTGSFTGADSFTFSASNSQTNSNTGTVTPLIVPTGYLFADTFSRPEVPALFTPWVQQLGLWAMTNGALVGNPSPTSYGYCYLATNWTDYTVQANVQFSAVNGWGGGIGGRLNPTTGAHYAAWIYPDGSADGGPQLKLVKFAGWGNFGGSFMGQVSLPAIGTNSHLLTLSFQSTNITVFVDSVQRLAVSDNSFGSTPALTSGGITTDTYCDSFNNLFQISVQNLTVAPYNGPEITQQPMSVTNVAGTTAQFTVSTIGPSLNYQWLFGGSPIAGAISSTLTITNVADTNAGTYTVVVSNTTSSVTSLPATLTVLDPPVIVTQPLSVTNKSASTVSFSVTASGTSLAYQWIKNGTNDLTNGGNVSGATSSSLSLSGITASDAASYTVAITNSAGAVTSSNATLTVTNVLPAAGVLFSDNFATNASLLPWIVESDNWSIAGGALLGGTNPTFTYGDIYLTNNWTNYAVQATFQFPVGAFGGGISGDVNPATGARYMAWVYPGGSSGGSNVISLIKFQSWSSWSYLGSPNTPMQQVGIGTNFGTNSHTIKLAFLGSRIAVYFDGNELISVTDAEASPYLNGGVSLDMWTDATQYQMSVRNVIVSPLVVDNSYSVNANSTLTVPAAGVLTNDTGVFGNALTALLLSGTQNGSLTFSNNGGFTYVPPQGYVGTNYFTYQANDGSTDLGQATATITVNGVHNGPTLPAQTNQTVLEQTLLTVTNTAIDTDVPALTLAYQLISPPTGASISTNGIISWTPSRTQGITTNLITTVVTDNGTPALSATNSFNVVVTAIATCLTPTNMFSEGFNEVTVTNLPSGWTSSATGVEKPWYTTNTFADTNAGTTNAAFAPDVDSIGLSYLVSPSIVLPPGQATLSFQHNYGFETGMGTDGFDGGVLEIKIGAGAFTDILAAGGSFLSGGYTSVIDTNYGNPLAGRQAWSGTNAANGVYSAVVVALPAASSGQTIQLRWGAGCDNGNGGRGWRLDAITLSNEYCAANGGPLLPAQTNRSVNELVQLTVTNSAVDGDVPPLTLSYQLVSPPAGAAVSTNGVITWTPTKAQGPSTNTITTIATDSGTPPFSATNSFQVVVNEINLPPLLPTQTNRTSVALTPVVVTNTATDQNVPAKPMSYGLQVAPVGATIDTNGIIRWTPVASQVPSTNTITTVVTNTDPLAVNATALTATNTFTLTITAIHNGPSLSVQTNQTVNELATLTVTNTAIDSDIPALALTYQLVSPPTGASINTNGIITWTPAKAQGPATNTITTIVTDNGTPALSATNSFQVVVNEINLPPLLPTQNTVTSAGLAPVIVTNTATDQNVPAKPMSYGLQAAPVGASFDSCGIIRWTPVASQVPSTNTITTVVTNTDPLAVNATSLAATNSFTVIINAIHNGPSLSAQTNQTVNELATLTVTNTASDSDIPALALTYQLVSPPAGANIDTNGIITWTPAKAQGPATNTITTIVTDNGTPALSATNSFQVVVNEINLPPLLPGQGTVVSAGLAQVIVTNTATDQNIPAKPMSYGLQAAPVGATIDSSGIIRWTPVASQVPSTNTITTVVTNTDPLAVNATALTATNSFTVIINAVHNGPSLPVQTTETVNELAQLTVTNTAIDSDVPALALTYQLVSPPTGASIDTNGIVTWTPTKAQGPATNTITTIVTDSGTPALSATNSFQVVVNEVNLPPLLPAQTNQTSVALTPVVVTNTATDQNIPAKPMSYGLQAAPVGATIDSNGIIRWTPVSSQVPSTNTITTVVTNTDPLAVNATALTATNTFTLTITAIHNGPSLSAQTNQTVNELATLTVTNTASDSDIPALSLTYQLVSPPAGANIDTNGIITWTPTKAQGPATNTITTVVTDSGTPALSATNSFQVVVNEVNLPPLLPNQGTVVSAGLAAVIVTNTATDQNIPAKPMSYGLQAAPVGATIDSSGIIRWTPVASQVPSTNTITTVVTNTDPLAVNATALTATNSFTVIINAVHNGPSLPVQTTETVNELAQLTVTNTAIDSDVPALALTYQLASPPAGANIDTNGIITWTPAKAQGPATNTMTTIVTDNGTPALSATNSFQVVVNEVNLPPLLPGQGTVVSAGLAQVIVTNTATDQNIPAKPMSYGLQAAPVGATIDSSGIIRWTPVASQVPSTNTITTVVTNTDPLAVNATALTATNSFTVIINAVHNGPSLPVQSNVTINDQTALTVTNTASDSDVPALSLAYQLVSPPGGMTIDGNGIIRWTPTVQEAGTTNLITTVVTDSGTPALSATNTFQVIVNPSQTPPAPQITNLKVSGGFAMVTWTSVSQHTYRLQYVTNVSSTNWTSVVPDVLAGGATATSTNNIGSSPERFYRVMVVQ
jgi:hypothetical protein